MSAVVALALALLFFVTKMLLAQKNKRTLTTSNPPPSPPTLPIIGNLHQLGHLPHRSLRALSDKLGPIMLLRLGEVPVLIVSSPETAREVMKTQDHVFATRPSLMAARKLLYDGRDIAFAPYGDYWRYVKKVSLLHLLSSKRVQSYRFIREEEVAFMLHTVSSIAPSPINMSRVLNSLAKDVIGRVALGKSSREYKWNEVIHVLIEESSGLLGEFYIGDFFPSLAWLGPVFRLDARARRISEKVNGILEEIVEDRRRSRDDKDDCSFVDILLSLESDLNKDFPFDKENIKAIVEDTFGAGTDSIYISMEWIMAELVRNPRSMKKLQEEVRGIGGDSTEMIKEEDLSNMSYLKAVIKEALRLHPPGPFLVPRESMEDTKMLGYDIQKGTRVLVNVWAIGRDPKVWDNPEEFRPERFMQGDPVDFKGHDFQLTPFGAGRRVCPGIQFTVPIIEMVVANLVHRFDWGLPNDLKREDMDMIEAPGLTTRMRTSLQLVAVPWLK